MSLLVLSVWSHIRVEGLNLTTHQSWLLWLLDVRSEGALFKIFLYLDLLLLLNLLLPYPWLLKKQLHSLSRHDLHFGWVGLKQLHLLFQVIVNERLVAWFTCHVVVDSTVREIVPDLTLTHDPPDQVLLALTCDLISYGGSLLVLMVEEVSPVLLFQELRLLVDCWLESALFEVLIETLPLLHSWDLNASRGASHDRGETISQVP